MNNFDLKQLIREEISKTLRREEDVTITRALFEDLVSKIANLPIEEVEKLTDLEKENILLDFSE